MLLQVGIRTLRRSAVSVEARLGSIDMMESYHALLMDGHFVVQILGLVICAPQITTILLACRGDTFADRGRLQIDILLVPNDHESATFRLAHILRRILPGDGVAQGHTGAPQRAAVNRLAAATVAVRSFGTRRGPARRRQTRRGGTPPCGRAGTPRGAPEPAPCHAAKLPRHTSARRRGPRHRSSRTPRRRPRVEQRRSVGRRGPFPTTLAGRATTESVQRMRARHARRYPPCGQRRHANRGPSGPTDVAVQNGMDASHSLMSGSQGLRWTPTGRRHHSAKGGKTRGLPGQPEGPTCRVAERSSAWTRQSGCSSCTGSTGRRASSWTCGCHGRSSWSTSSIARRAWPGWRPAAAPSTGRGGCWSWATRSVCCRRRWSGRSSAVTRTMRTTRGRSGRRFNSPASRRLPSRARSSRRFWPCTGCGSSW